jgi:hypothetical protein
MRYSKKQVNKIIDRVISAAHAAELGLEHNVKFEKRVELIREEHLLIDRRVSALPEYTTSIVSDFLELKLSYKDLMEKYHCSGRNLRGLLMECGESDDRVWREIESRRH